MEAQRQGISYPELLEKEERERDEDSVRNPIEAMLQKAEASGNGAVQPRLNDFQQPSNEKKVRNFLSEPEHKIDSPH